MIDEHWRKMKKAILATVAPDSCPFQKVSDRVELLRNHPTQKSGICTGIQQRRMGFLNHQNLVQRPVCGFPIRINMSHATYWSCDSDGKTIGPIAKNPPSFFVTKKWINSSDPQFFLGKIVHVIFWLNTPFNVPICFMLPAAPAKALRSLSP